MARFRQRVERKLIRMPTTDHQPWAHPFLNRSSLSAFAEYSAAVHDWAAIAAAGYRPPSCVFTVNMAQNMHNWAVLSQNAGWDVALMPHPHDLSALSDPAWEYFDGAFAWPLDGSQFKAIFTPKSPVPVVHVPMDGVAFLEAANSVDPDRRDDFLVSRYGGRYFELLNYTATYPYFAWAKAISKFDVSYAAASPIASFASGKPYRAFSVGGDLQFECGRLDPASILLRKSFASANFLLASNPVTLGHARRLGLQNLVHVPYPISTKRYSPGEGRARKEWKRLTEGELFVLITSRIDSAVKGNGANLIEAMRSVVERVPSVRFVFLSWGDEIEDLKRAVDSAGLSSHVLLLPTVGKSRLIDYYRSADVVLDQLVSGYYGASALEAMSIGVPVVMRMNEDQYSPLYFGDTAPVADATDNDSLVKQLSHLCLSAKERKKMSKNSRQWIVRHHSENEAGQKMLNLLTVAAYKEFVPMHILRQNPLLWESTDEENSYHSKCVGS